MGKKVQNDAKLGVLKALPTRSSTHCLKHILVDSDTHTHIGPSSAQEPLPY